MTRTRLELAGQDFWSWHVESFAGMSSRGHTSWNCTCECGYEQIIEGSRLKNGYTKSCGCKVAEISRIRETTHGMAKTPLHKIWLGMKNRCYNSNTISYRNYGGRGIKLCERWVNSFENFYSDMSETYKFGLTIERKEVDKDYSPDNCTWIPKAEQSRNRTNTIWVDTEKGLMTVAEAAKVAGVSWFCMYSRHLRKCPINKILSGPNKAGRSFTNVQS